MPHLSPMMWIISTLLFTLLFTMMTSSIWWWQFPKFPSNLLSMKSCNKTWKWEYFLSMFSTFSFHLKSLKF